APAPARRRYLLETLVVLRRDRIGDLPAALDTQRRLVALDPDDAGAWVAQRDLELAVALAPGGGGGEPGAATLLGPGLPARGGGEPGAATLLELALRAGGGAPAVTAALHIEAARLVAGAPDQSGQRRQQAEALYRQARAEDRSGLAAAGLEAIVDGAPARLDA